MIPAKCDLDENHNKNFYCLNEKRNTFSTNINGFYSRLMIVEIKFTSHRVDEVPCKM